MHVVEVTDRLRKVILQKDLQIRFNTVKTIEQLLSSNNDPIHMLQITGICVLQFIEENLT